MTSKVLWYALFLIVSIVLSGIALSSLSDLRKTSRSWLRQEAGPLSLAGSIYLYGLLLAKYSSFLIPGFYFVAAQIPIFVNTAFQASSVPEDRDRYWYEIIWASECQSVRYRWLQLASIFSIVAYGFITVSLSVLVAIVYFTTTVPSTAATLAFIRIPMLSVLLAGVVFLPAQVAISLFESLSIPARRRLLSVSLAELVPTGMIIATLLWTFSSSANVPDHAGIRFHLAYFPAVLLILAVYFAITCLPSILGFIQGGRQQSLLLERRTDTLTEAIEILRIPKVDLHIPVLTALVTKLQQQRSDYAKADKSIEKARQLDDQKMKQDTLSSAPAWDRPGFYRTAHDSTNVQTQPQSVAVASSKFEDGGSDENNEFRNAYHNARPYDIRFQYLDWLDSQVEKLQMTSSDLQTKPEPAVEFRAALAWADSYEDNRRELREKASRTKTNAVGAAVLSTLVTSVVGVVLTGFGSWLWTYVAQTLPS